jgi:phosphotriesterase-related protein
VSALEERVHRAAARASRRTGLAITTHGVLSDVGRAQLRIFEDEGADPARVVIGHADSYPLLDHYLAIVQRGASVEFDFLGMTFTPQERHGEGRIVELVCELLTRGHVERVLLSQDVCHNSQLKRYGGNGYVHLVESFLPRLRAAGASEDEIETMTVANPRRLLSVG